MPYPNEHSARLRNPDDFIQDSFRRQNIEDNIDIIIGKLKGEDKMTTQSYRFKSDKFTVKEAKSWLKDHEIEYIAFEPASENKSVMNEKEVKTFGEKLDAIIAKISNFSRLTENKTIKNVDGKEFTIEKDAGDPAVGDKASPNGVFTLENGKKVTIAGGEITEITEPESDSELKAAKEEIETLKAKISEMETAKAETDKTIADYAKSKEEADKIVTELKALKNSWKPDGRNNRFSTDKVGDVDVATVRENLKAKKQVINVKI